MAKPPTRRDVLSGALLGFGAPLVADQASATPGLDEIISAHLQLESIPTNAGAGLREIVNVKTYGAHGDFDPERATGTDDTAAINVAIGACVAGQTLYFPPGSYLVSTSGRLERALRQIPIGVDVYMATGATIYPSTTNPVIAVFTPLGKNRLRLNVDGRSLPMASAVESEDWRNYSVGVRAYANNDLGLGADDVTIWDSRFENLGGPIQADGASRWMILNCVFRRYKQSGVLLGYYAGCDSCHNLIAGNYFEDAGDTAVAWHGVSDHRGGEAAYNVVTNNRARNWALRTAGFAFDVEETVSKDVTLQHHFLFAGNAIEHSRSDIAHQLGGLTMSYVGHGLMIGNTAKGALASSADIGMAMVGGKHGLITGNHVSDWLGGGAVFDGDDVHVIGNTFTNCGGPGAAYAIKVGLLNDTRSCSVSHNRLTISGAYGHYAPGDKAIGVVARGGMKIRDINIDDNILTAPNDEGVAVYGTAAAPIANVSICRNTMIARETEEPPARIFESWGIDLSHVVQATVSGNIFKDAKYAFSAQNCAGVTLADNELKGDGILTALYCFPGSTGVRVRNTRCYQSVRTPVLDGQTGTGTKWENDDKVITSARGQSAAIASGATIAHGLSSRPGFVSITAAAIGPTDVSATADATSITVRFSGGAAAEFYWEAHL
jgi:hypothetical protein